MVDCANCEIGVDYQTKCVIEKCAGIEFFKNLPDTDNDECDNQSSKDKLKANLVIKDFSWPNADLPSPNYRIRN
ncbi:hypothetical protein GJ496_010949 [Pomphorhynchus laevis]|nr:hypothetical protein GJ496_010949 [Pomphorhynchus laevis]